MRLICAFFVISSILSCTQTSSGEKKKADIESFEKQLSQLSTEKRDTTRGKIYQTAEKEIKFADTLFLKRIRTKDHYHGIYIDNTPDAAFKKSARKMKITKPLQQKINERLAEIKDRQSPPDLKLPQFWLPLEKYKDDYYLYQPCDGIFEYKYLVTKDVVANLFYDGPSISAIKYAERINSQHYRFEFHDPDEWDKLDIFIIDPKKNIAVFRFSGNQETWYQLFTSSSSITHFGVIVNDCRTQKEKEFTFEKVDFETLIEKTE